MWADTLSRYRSSQIEWELKQSTFDRLIGTMSPKPIDLFASHSNRKTDCYLTQNHRTPTGGPNAFSEDWSKWPHLYLFPPPDMNLMSNVVNRLRYFTGQVSLVCPIWPAQAWYAQIRAWCPNQRPLQVSDFHWGEIGDLKISLSFALHSFRK